MTTTFIDAWYIAFTIFVVAMSCLKSAIDQNGFIRWLNVIGVLCAIALLCAFINEQYF